MKMYTIVFAQCDMSGRTISHNIPESVKGKLLFAYALDPELTLLKIFHDRKTGNFFRVFRYEHNEND